ncbi:uncharacterized protein Z519_04711 [Cladophialophora bantiana CBS 173.52]|uniref:Zn(2)-C6 fungal-type domain-containing protein n=1 Tax=Cladophialophora bantiana (strain ATCC 10958 / CBS 173.52 / CDC B-1940 / NIH 8579) TaxID=1442370 RepID=A0A0D2IDA9_CLAB1|nr:uncharacterized protein Z519_04711 [Cladophialophora bantiana CBS 173.52]KIW94734.1 hypothetical protein Z519_04711 [Cladophialophora bantiana CBS 173.52]
MHRRRALKACTSCHERKIRCDVDIVEVPCTKCSETGNQCTLRTRKAYSPRGQQLHQTSRLAAVDNSRANEQGLVHSDVEDSNSAPSVCPQKVARESQFLGAGISSPSATIPASVFIGDKHGYGAVLDATVGGNVADRYLLIATTTGKSLAPEDLEYLRAKGCFSLPSEKVCSELIKVYFCFVHPTFPVLDGAAFLRDYANQGLSHMNLLLVWSMFSVAASYISDTTMQVAGYKSRIMMKDSIVTRAKLLYQLSHENDKTVLLQAALLLSFWFVDADDVMQSWYWSGIAFGLAQTLGLHRDPCSAHQHTQYAFGRTLWWCCMLRDAWLAFSMGRPLRLNRDHCSTSMPLIPETQLSYQGMVFESKEFYSSGDAAAFAEIWHRLLITSEALRELLGERHKPRQSRRSSTHVDELSSRVFSHSEAFIGLKSKISLPRRVAMGQLQLYEQAALIALLRPDRPEQTGERLRAAAAASTSALQAFINDGTVAYAGPVSIPLIAPAMHTFLLAMKSSNPLLRKVAVNNLDLHFLFLSELEENYPAASIVHNLFKAAKESVASQTAAGGHDNPDSSSRTPQGYTWTGPNSPSHSPSDCPFDKANGPDYFPWLPSGAGYGNHAPSTC